MNGVSMMDSVDKAMMAVRQMIVLSSSGDSFKGIPVEACLEVIDSCQEDRK